MFFFSGLGIILLLLTGCLIKCHWNFLPLWYYYGVVVSLTYPDCCLYILAKAKSLLFPAHFSHVGALCTHYGNGPCLLEPSGNTCPLNKLLFVPLLCNTFQRMTHDDCFGLTGLRTDWQVPIITQGRLCMPLVFFFVIFVYVCVIGGKYRRSLETGETGEICNEIHLTAQDWWGYYMQCSCQNNEMHAEECEANHRFYF